jgi:hypothetical protein
MKKDLMEEDRDVQREEEKNRFWSKVTEIFSDHPTLAVTAAYVYLTAVGMVYSASLYSKFGINILDHSEIADFVLGAFKNLSAFFLGVAQAVLAIFFGMWWGRRVRVRYGAGPGAGPGARIKLRPVALTLTLTVIAYSVAIPYLYASFAASSIKDGEKTEMKVLYRSFKGSAGQATLSEVELIGAT